MDSVLMLAFLSLFFVFFFWIYFMDNLLNLPKCKLLHVTEPKKIKFLVLQRYPHSDPRKPCNSLPQCNKTERSLQCFIIILDFFLRTSCTSTSVTFASQMKTAVISRYLLGNCVASLGNLRFSEASQKLVHSP